MPPLRQVEMPSGVLIPHQEEKHLPSIFGFCVLRIRERLKKVPVVVVPAAAEGARPGPAQPCARRTEDSSSAGWAAVPITDDENLIIDFNGS